MLINGKSYKDLLMEIAEERALTEACRTSNRKPREAAFVSKAMKLLSSIGGNWEKRHGTAYGKAGQPDITGCVCGHRVEIEVKVGRNEPTEIQIERLAEWARAGAKCAVLWDASVQKTEDQMPLCVERLINACEKRQVDITPLIGLDDLETFIRVIIGEPRRWDIVPTAKRRPLFCGHGHDDEP